MTSSDIEIRSAGHADLDRVLAVHRDAFGAEEGDVIADLVAKMLGDSSAEPFYSFLAEQGSEIVGHVLFTAVRIETNGGEGGANVTAQILAPLAVAGDHQGGGIGTKLVEESLEVLQSNGVELVFVLGYPDYYLRFGFTPAGARGYQAPYPIPPKNADAWMIKELAPSAIEDSRGTVRCCDVLNDPQFWRE